MLDIDSAKYFANLAQDADEPALKTIYTEPYGDFLPTEIPLSYNRKLNALESIRPLIEEWRSNPERKTGVATADTIESFVALTKRHQTPNSALFFNARHFTSAALSAVIDYHGENSDSGETIGIAHHLKHQIKYSFPLTDEMTLWIKALDRPMAQKAFSNLIEARIVDITKPTAEEKTLYLEVLMRSVATPPLMMQISRSMSLNINEVVESGFNAQTGETTAVFKTTHNKTIETEAMPSMFLLSIRPYVGGDYIRIPMLFSYELVKVSDDRQELRWTISAHGLADHLRELVVARAMKAAEATSLPLFEGSPEI